MLRLDRAVCAYDGTVILNGLSLSVQHGELRGVIGPNGAGKSTLFNLLTGIAPHVGGTIELNRRIIHPTPATMARHGIARTFQHPRVFDRRTVRTSLQLASELSGRSVPLSHLDWVIDLTSIGTILDAPCGRLSHHQRRILTIAMAIATCPIMLLLDEPSAGLDDTETASVKELIRAIHQQMKCAVLLIEHKLSLVMELCERLTVLDYGEIIAEGDPASVASNPVVVEAYLGS